ncbi:hypothetical protein BDZ45DRAFT_746719 [Acephala macrosclerotiorum]|nr:hypothetical protein BDZ45DRAFT_746719 [Acephala macrosclerotiorum]
MVQGPNVRIRFRTWWCPVARLTHIHPPNLGVASKALGGLTSTRLAIHTWPLDVIFGGGPTTFKFFQIPPNFVSELSYVGVSSSHLHESGFEYSKIDENFSLDHLFTTRKESWNSSLGNFEYLQAQLDNGSAFLNPVPGIQIPIDSVNSSLRLDWDKIDSDFDFDLDLDFDGGLQLQRSNISGATRSVLSFSSPFLNDFALFDAAAGLHLDNVTALSSSPRALDLDHQSPAPSATEPPSSTCALHTSAPPKPPPLVLTASSNAATTIECTWPSCSRSFTSMTDYNHHIKNHTKPFICLHCPARHATKRHLDRHVNERHHAAEQYFCPVVGCKRSRIGGHPFPRPENCKRHLMSVHKLDGNAAGELDMNEETRQARESRKQRKRVEVVVLK